MKKLIIIIIISAFILYGRTIIIPDDYATIQEGINNSADSDTVLVNPGIYFENINFSGKKIVLGSLFLSNADTSYISQTVINGNASGSVVIFENGESTETKLIGFTLTNGYALKGAGVLILNSNPEISDNIITKNRSQHLNDYGDITLGYGSGLYLVNSGSNIFRNQIINNFGAVDGGGMYILNSEGISVINNIISNNMTENFWASQTSGGAIYISNSTKITIYNCIFSENYACFDDYADQIFSSSSGVAINKCTFYNTGKNDASSMFSLYNGVSISNSIIWHGDNFLGPVLTSASNPEITYSNIINWQGGNYNISADPLFENLLDFRLELQSPCINRGDPLYQIDPDGTVTDMGCFSYDLSGYGYISGTISLDEGPRSINNIQIKAGSEISAPLSSGDYKMYLLPGNYTLSAHLTPQVSSYINDIQVIQGSANDSINFHLPNDSANYKFIVAKDGSSEYLNIRDAVNSTISGDSVVISDGIFYENVSLVNKHLTITSSFIFDNDSSHIENTIIDGENVSQPIFIDNSSGKCKIAGLTIKNGLAEYGGGCYIRSSNLDISDCRFINNRGNNSGGALYGLFSTINITECSFKENSATAGGALCNISSEMSIIDSELSLNNATISCGAIYSNSSSLELINSEISHNTADEYGGVWSRYPEKDYYENNKIIGNSARFGGGLSFEHKGENSFVVNNLITGNHSTIYGGGVYCANAVTAFVNNTIVGNICDGKGGGIAIYSASGSSCEPRLYNNIIWNNSAAEGNQIALGGDGSYPIFNNSDIQGGKQNVHYFLSAVAIPDSNYVNNIDSDPLFLDEWNGDYFLSENSPCIDLGTESIPDSLIFPVYDLAGNKRIYGSTIDIGAYEWNGVGIEDSSVPQTTELYQNYPNPFNPVTSISYALSQAVQAELSVFNLNGQLVRSLVNGKQEKGSHKVEFDACDLTSGLYIYTLKVDGKAVQSRKMMLLK